MESASSGVKFNDRVLAGKVRTLTLEQIKVVLESEPKLDTDIEFKRALILKLASNILPRLSEISGPDGAPIPILGGASLTNVISENNSS